MLIDVKVPVLAESVAEATLMNWHKQPGDAVKRGDSLIDIETDKVTLEVAAPNDGTLKEILKGDGELVASDEVIAKIDTETTAKAATSAPEKKSSDNHKPEQQSLPVEESSDADQKLSPTVRKLLQEHNLDAVNITSNRKDGRLTKEDILKHLQNNPQTEQKQAKPATPQPKPAQSAKPTQTVKPVQTAKSVQQKQTIAKPVGGTSERPEERVPMTSLRRRAAERLLSAQQENAILTTFNEVNMQPVMELRKHYKDDFEKIHSIKLGFMSFFTKAVVEALKKFPLVNASIDGTDIVYHGYFDIGMAVSSPKGLVVPIVRDADLLSFAEIESKIREYGEKARDSKLTIEELTGGTFTITNGGVFGSLLSTPIINPPQSAILGMHAIQERPCAENGEVVVRPMMYLALSYDHRIIDGREAVQFLVCVKQNIEDPARLLLQI